mgnify:CR=1 FL=1|jgi:hypothetical protein
MANPFHTYPGLMERSTHLTHLSLRNDPAIVAYQFWGQTTVNGAYGNPAASGVGGAGAVTMFTVGTDTTFRSPLLQQKGLGLVEENRRGTTHALFDIDDYLAPTVALPPDSHWLYLRVQENRRVAGLLTVPGPLPVLGGIYCLPPASSFGQSKPTFTMQGIAPSATTSAAGAPPVFSEDLTSAIPRPMYLVFPVPMSEFTLVNLDVAKTLLVSFGPNQLMQAIAPGDEVQLYSGSTKGLVLACPGAAGCPFALHGVLARG